MGILLDSRRMPICVFLLTPIGSPVALPTGSTSRRCSSSPARWVSGGPISANRWVGNPGKREVTWTDVQRDMIPARWARAATVCGVVPAIASVVGAIGSGCVGIGKNSARSASKGSRLFSGVTGTSVGDPWSTFWGTDGIGSSETGLAERYNADRVACCWLCRRVLPDPATKSGNVKGDVCSRCGDSVFRLLTVDPDAWEQAVERGRDHRPIEDRYVQEAYYAGIPKYLHDRFLDRRLAGESPDEIARELSVFSSKRDRHIPCPTNPNRKPRVDEAA